MNLQNRLARLEAGLAALRQSMVSPANLYAWPPGAPRPILRRDATPAQKDLVDTLIAMDLATAPYPPSPCTIQAMYDRGEPIPEHWYRHYPNSAPGWPVWEETPHAKAP